MICICPDGTIPIVYINVPGSVHDSQVANSGNIYGKLESVYERDGAQCTVDSAFDNVGRKILIKLSQDLILIPNHHEQRIARDDLESRSACDIAM